MSFKPLVIAIDLDSTVCDLLSEWLRLYNTEYDATTSLSDIKYWEMAKNVPIGKDIYKYLGDDDLYCRLDPFPGAIETVKEFHDSGHEIHILTAPSPGFEQTAADKLRWCKQFLPFIPFNRISLIHAKERFVADVLIDDSPGHLESHYKTQRQSKRIAIAYPYNECAAQFMDLRADSFEQPDVAWEAIRQYIKGLESENSEEVVDERV